MKKIEYALENFKDLNKIILCPYCKQGLKIKENSLICKNNHTFNVSKKGTTILYKVSKIKKDKIYNKDLFDNRRNFINRGFYDELHNKVSEIINKYTPNIILDMGSGEGTHDIKVINILQNKNIKIIGLDLSKEGIDLSNDFIGKNYIGIVGDLNQLPIKDNTIDLILNILSPSNETEMARVLKKSGIIIKITPKFDYLHELRETLGIKNYENEDIIDNNIKNKYDIIEKYDIVHTYSLDKKELDYLAKMTPLMNYVDSMPDIKSITIALNVYVLRIKDGK